METFLRAMLKVDPSYPPAAAKLENFPLSDFEPEADIQAAALFEAKLIDLEELQSAIAVIKGKSS